jgi:cob(I)alamin adenosyltransferase
MYTDTHDSVKTCILSTFINVVAKSHTLINAIIDCDLLEACKIHLFKLKKREKETRFF